MKNMILNWRDIPVVYVNAETMNDLINEMKELEKKNQIKKVDFYTARNAMKVYRTYCVKTSQNSSILRIAMGVGRTEQFSFNAHLGVQSNKVETVSGREAWDFIEALFFEEYGDKKSLFTAFSSPRYKEEYKKIKRCVPKPISMINPMLIGMKVKHCYKADTSSAYPSEGTKPIPTLHACKTFKGVQKPTQEYPFCFYTKSHHMAIYGELDTRTWAKRKRFYTLYDEMFDDSVLPEDDETIMCKASEYSLKPIFERVYKMKLHGNKEAKMGMNAAIGYMQKDTNPKLSHISAVIIARCCERIMIHSYNLMKEGNVICFIATDSVVWCGKPSNEATEKKFLGSFTYELRDGSFYGVGPKAYQTIDSHGNVTTKYSGMANGEEKDNLKFGDLPTLKGGGKRYIIHEDGKVEEIL